MAAVAVSVASTLHEGVGHGLTARLRGEDVTELTSNHLLSEPPDRWVAAGGTLVNLAAGICSLLLSCAAGRRANLRYLLWIFGALNLLFGSGYLLFSGVMGVGDWQQVIEDTAHYAGLRIAMALAGALLYVTVVRWVALGLAPFVQDRSEYNTLGRWPYLVACAVDICAGAFDPLGVHLLLISTIPAVMGGLSGLLWADIFLPRDHARGPLAVRRSVGLWIAAAVIAALFVAVLGRGLEFRHVKNSNAFRAGADGASASFAEAIDRPPGAGEPPPLPESGLDLHRARTEDARQRMMELPDN